MAVSASLLVALLCFCPIYESEAVSQYKLQENLVREKRSFTDRRYNTYVKPVKTYTISKPDQYFNQFEERLVDRDNVEYDFRLRLTPRSQKLVEYSPEFDDFVALESAASVKEEPAKTTTAEKAVTGRGNGGRGRGSKTKTLTVSRPSSLKLLSLVGEQGDLTDLAEERIFEIKSLLREAEQTLDDRSSRINTRFREIKDRLARAEAHAYSHRYEMERRAYQKAQLERLEKSMRSGDAVPADTGVEKPLVIEAISEEKPAEPEVVLVLEPTPAVEQEPVTILIEPAQQDETPRPDEDEPAVPEVEAAVENNEGQRDVAQERVVLEVADQTTEESGNYDQTQEQQNDERPSQSEGEETQPRYQPEYEVEQSSEESEGQVQQVEEERPIRQEEVPQAEPRPVELDDEPREDSAIQSEPEELERPRESAEEVQGQQEEETAPSKPESEPVEDDQEPELERRPISVEDESGNEEPAEPEARRLEAEEEPRKAEESKPTEPEPQVAQVGPANEPVQVIEKPQVVAQETGPRHEDAHVAHAEPPAVQIVQAAKPAPQVATTEASTTVQSSQNASNPEPIVSSTRNDRIPLPDEDDQFKILNLKIDPAFGRLKNITEPIIVHAVKDSAKLDLTMEKADEEDEDDDEEWKKHYLRMIESLEPEGNEDEDDDDERDGDYDEDDDDDDEEDEEDEEDNEDEEMEEYRRLDGGLRQLRAQQGVQKREPLLINDYEDLPVSRTETLIKSAASYNPEELDEEDEDEE